MNSKKVLIISYLFPPLGGGGVIRTTKFVKYLPQFGWRPYVLTVKKGFYPHEDKSLLQEIPKKVEAIRIRYLEPAFWIKNKYWQSFLAYLIYPFFLIPDRQMLWFLPALITALKILKKEKIKIVFTSSAPVSDHLIGLVIKKLTGVKWIADFRDEWAKNPFKKYPTPLHRLINQYLEKKVVQDADQIVTVSDPITEYLKSLSNNKEKFFTITNGFDEEDFETLPVVAVLRNTNQKFKIVHIGGLYSIEYENSFIKAFKGLNLKNAYLNFIGTQKRLPHKEAIKKMLEADLLLLILDPIERPAVLTGKLFEYLRAKKPILAVARKNTIAARIINKYQVGLVVEPDQKSFKKGILEMYQKWLNNDLKTPKINIDQYQRKNLTSHLAKIFDKMALSHPKIRMCLIGNIQSSQNQNLCRYFVQKGYDIHFISTKPGRITGAKIYVLSDSRFTPWYFLKSLIKIRKIIREVKPDIVHGQDLVFGGIWAYSSGFRPYVVTPWGSDVINYDKFIDLEKYLIRKTLREADLVTTSSLALKHQAEKIGLQKNKTQMIHFGIDLDVFKNRSKSQIGLIFCPRTIGSIYNIDILIKVFAKISHKNKNVRLALLSNIADENYLLEVEKLIIRYDLVDKVIFWPKVDNKQMAQYYSKADVVVTISSSDGCSVSFLEAMACEKKIVATDLPYIEEWIKGKNIWRVPVRDVNATAKAILTALKFPQAKWRKIGQANRHLIAEKAEIESNFEKLDELYRRLIK